MILQNCNKKCAKMGHKFKHIIEFLILLTGINVNKVPKHFYVLKPTSRTICFNDKAFSRKSSG